MSISSIRYAQYSHYYSSLTAQSCEAVYLEPACGRSHEETLAARIDQWLNAEFKCIYVQLSYQVASYLKLINNLMSNPKNGPPIKTTPTVRKRTVSQ